MTKQDKDENKKGLPNDKDLSKGDGKISEAEKTLSYIVDVITVSMGAAVFSCLLLNLAGK
jgi:hypothetical protein